MIVDVRDGLFLQNASRGRISRNHVSDVRYGLHYMFSDDNVFEDNTFERGAAGSAIMYSERIAFRRNRFLSNRGFASVGLLLQQCDDVLAEDNLIADNAQRRLPRGHASRDAARKRHRADPTRRSSCSTPPSAPASRATSSSATCHPSTWWASGLTP